MPDPIIINGKKFITSKQGAALTGYARDYIGQLVRMGKVEGKVVEKTLFVSQDSLLAHLELKNGNAKVVENSFKTAIAENTAKVNLPKTTPVSETVVLFPKLTKVVSKPAIIKTDKIVSKFKNKSSVPAVVAVIAPYADAIGKISSYALKHAIGVVAVLTVLTTSYASIKSPELFLRNMSEVFSNNSEVVEGNTASLFAPVRTLAMNVNKNINDFFGLGTSGTTIVQLPPKVFVATSTIVREVVRDIGTTTIIRYGSTAAPVVIDNTQNIDALVAEVNILKQYQKEQLEGIFDSVARGRRTTTTTTTTSSSDLSGTTTLTNLTVENTSTSTIPNLNVSSSLTLNGDIITDFVGSGLELSNGVLTATAGAGFSTTSSDFHFNTRLAATTTLNNLTTLRGLTDLITTNATTTTFALGADYVTDLTGSGLSIVNGALTVAGGSFSTTSADYWETQQVARWATTSDSFAFDTRLAATTTLNNLYNLGGLATIGSTTGTTTFLGGAIFNRNVGIGTTSPYAKLSVVGQTVAEYFTATSTTATSTFPLLSTNALSLNGTYVTSFWATTSDSFAFDTRLAATTTLNNITTLRGLTDIISTRATTTNATSTSLFVSIFGIGSDYITDLTGSNLSIVNGALTATDLTFSTTSADYWETQQVARWATTSDSYAFDTRLAATTTLNNLTTLRGLTDLITTNATTTTFALGADYVTDLTGSGLSIVNGALTVSGGSFSTTSADYYLAATTTLNNLTKIGPQTTFSFDHATGTSLYLTSLNCTVNSNGGKITTDSSGQLVCANDQTGAGGGGGSDVNWTFFNNSGISVGTTSNQVVIGASATSSVQKLEVIGGVYINGNVGIGTTSPYAKLSVVGTGVFTNVVATSTTADSVFPRLTSTFSTTTNATTTNFFATTASTSNLFVGNNLSISSTSQAANLVIERNDGLNAIFLGRSGAGSATLGISFANGIPTIAPSAGALNIASAITDGSNKNMRLTFAHYNSVTSGQICAVVGGADSTSSNLGLGGGSAGCNAATIVALYTSANTTSTTGTVGFVMDSVQNVGIGTQVPTAKLHLAGRSGSTTDIFKVASSTGEEYFTIKSTGNIGIGTSSPYAKLSVNGDVVALTYTATSTTATSTFPLLSTNALSLNGTYVTSLWATTSDSFAFDTRLAATTTLNNLYNLGGLATIGSTTGTTTFLGGAIFNGNVGIGTTSPYAKFSVTNTGTGPSFVVEDATSPDNTPFIIDASGNVGIGTTTPTAKLHISGMSPTDGSNSIKFTSTTDSRTWQIGPGAPYTQYSGFTIYDETAFATRLIVDNTGNIGIGSTTPGAKLVVKGSGSTTGINFQTTNSANAPLFTILDSGNVGIGTTSPYAKLSVVGQTVAEYFTATSTTATSTFPLLSTNALSLNGTYVTSLWATTSDSFAFDTRLAATTTLNNITNLNRVTLNAATTSSLAVTGILSSLLKTNSDGSVVAAVAGTDYLASAITAIGPANQTQTGATVTIASSTSTTNGLTAGITIIGSGNTLTLTPALSGVLTVGGGGTGISSPSAGGILVGNYSGNGWQQIATSSLGLLTTDVAEGSNLYWTNNRFDVRLSATTTLSNLATLAGLVSIGSTSATTTFRGNINVTGQTAMNGATIETNTGLTVRGAVDSGDSTYAVRGNARGSNTTFGALGYDNTTACTGICNVAGVYGETTNGKAIVGSASGATGVAGYFSSATGNAVETYSTDGYGLSVSSTNSRGLSVSGSTYSIYATGGQNYFEGNVGIGTTSPYAKLSVVGQTVAEYFTATSTTATSTFPLLSTNALSLNGTYVTSLWATTSDSFAFDTRLAATTTLNNLFTLGGLASIGSTTGTTTFLGGAIFNRNVGIGTTTPDKLLDVAGVLRVEGYVNDGKITGKVGNVGGLELFGGSDFNVGAGIVLRGASRATEADTIRFTRGAYVTSMLIDNQGNVGVGTTSPYAKLSVVGQTVAEYFTATSTTATSTFPLLSTNALSLNGTYVTSLWATTSDTFSFNTLLAATTTLNNLATLEGLSNIGSTTGTTILNGKLGVATSSPWGKLSVSQTGAAPSFVVEDSTNDSTPFVVDESGNVAIGTSTPTAKLEIAGGTSGDRVRFITVGGASNRTLDFDRTIATGAWSIQSYVSSSSGTKTPILLNPNGGGIAVATTSTTLPATLAVGGSIYSADGIYAGGGIYSPGEIQAGRLIATTTKTQFISNTNVTTLYTYGDSITQGSNASSTSEYYVNIIAKTLKYTLVNQGIAGSLLEEDAQIDSIYDQPVSTTTVATILTGYNNHRYYGTSAARLDTYKQALPAALAYLAIPDMNKKYGYDFSTTGTWTATSTYATSTGIFSRTAGSTASTVLHGNTIYVVGTRGTANDTGTMTITVDGVDKGTYSCAGTLASSNDSRVYAPFMMRVGNLSNGPHTVKVTSNNTGYCEINWASGNANVSADGAPAVYVGGALRMTDADYITNGIGGSIASNRLYNQVIEGTVKTLASDGLNVIKVDAEEAYDAATMVSFDRVHPNAAGHSMLAQVFLNKMSGTSFGNDKNFARFFSGYVPKFTIGAGTSTTFTFDGETGRFGIGSSTPLATLSLTGTVGTDPLLIASSTGSHMLTVLQSGNVGIGSSTPFGRFSVDTSNLLAGIPSFVVGSSTKADLIVLQNGNVGLGTTTPYAKLAIDTSDTTSSANAAFMVGSSTKTDFMIGAASGNISIGTTTNTRAKVTITNLGNQPGLFLDGGLAGSDMFRFVRSDANGGTGNYGLALKIQSSNPAFMFRSGTSAVSEGTSVNGFAHISSTNSFMMSTTTSSTGVFSGYEPMYVTNSNANIGFAGTTTPFGSVSINGVFQSAGEPTFVVGSSTKTDLIVTQGGNIGVGTTSPWRTFSTNGTVAMNGLTTAAGTPSSICMNATTKEITVNAATSCVVSDRDQKQQIEDLTVSGLDAIRAIKPVTFAYNDIPGRSRIGFIAQDLQAVDNRLGDAFDKQGIARSIDIPAILSITVKAVKELDIKTELQASKTESRFLEVIGTKPSSADNFLVNGDLSFKNKFGIKTESIDSPTKYLTIHSSDGSNIITFAENGNIGIGLGSSTPAYKLQVQGDIAATAFVNISTMESKTGIKYLTDEKKEDILTALNKMKIAQYRYKSEDQSNPLRLGLIAEEAPSEVLSVSGKGVDIYKLTTFTLAAVQAQQKKIESFETRLTALEAKVASSTATTTDSMIASVIAGIKNLFVDELTVGTKEKATGITLFDDETGAPFCIKISGGTMKSTEGACGITTKPKEEVKEDPKPTIPAPTQNATSTASTTPQVKETPKEPVASSTPSTGGSTSPKPEAPKVEETKPAEVTPAPEAPKEEAPKVEEKKEEAPKEESKPKEETPKSSETTSAPSVDSTN